MNTLTPQYIDQRLRLPWTLICQMACQAMIRKVSFEDVVEMAMRAEAAR
jgi:hypothetical protein